MSTFLDHIIDYIAGMPAIGDLARARAERSIADTLGVMFAGARSEVARPLLAYAEGIRGNVPVIGAGRTTSAEMAAMLNASLGHAFDFDDGFPGYPVHASNVVTACLISGCAGRAVTGRDFCTAFVSGVEVAIAVGRRIGLRHYERGFHATATLGVFGGIAGLAVLSEMDRRLLRNALGIGASFASGLQRNFGTMTKPLHAGWAARNAIISLALARAGIDAHDDAFEGPDGFLAAYGEPGDPTVSNAPPAFDAIETTGLGLKKFPCVNACHRPIDGVLGLCAEHEITADRVRRIVCLVPPGSLRPIKYTDPRTPHEAKFSINYVLAAALVDRTVGLGSFTDEAIFRPEVRALFGRVEAREDAGCDGPKGDTRGPGTRGKVVVRIETDAGVWLERAVEFAPGNPRREMTCGDLAEKMIGCMTFGGLARDRAAELAESVLGIGTASDVGALVTFLSAA